MENILKSIFWAVIVLVSIIFIGKLLLWLLPFIIIVGVGIYLYGKYKLNKFVKQASEVERNNYKTTNTTNTIVEDDEVNVVDVEFKEAE